MGESRDPYVPTRRFRSGISYGSLALAATWLVWTAFEFRDLQHWLVAQGVTRFRYPTVELICGILLLILGAVLARTKYWVAIPAISVAVALGAEMLWIGATA